MLDALRQAVRAEVPGAERDFWLRAEARGTPLVEPDPEGDPVYRLVTFLWRDDPERPAEAVLAVLHTVTDKDRYAKDLTPHLMERVEGTGVWALTHRLRADHRASYQFHTGPPAELLRTDRASWRRVLDEAVPDPLSRTPPLPARGGRNPASVLELPEAPPQPYAVRPAGASRGTSVRTALDGRGVTVHLPHGHGHGHGQGQGCGGGAAGGPYAVAVLLDGEMWGPVLGAGDILDGLHADGQLPPTIGLFVDTMSDRMEDLSCSGAFTDWLADTLLPWAAARYGAAADPARTLVAGQSAGGLTAAYAIHRRPDVFGLALSQSGAFWWPDPDPSDENAPAPEWLTRQYASTARRPVRLHLEVGTQEWMLLSENRRLRNVLRARGYAVTYEEFNGGHDYACWRGGLARGLVKLLGE
ncbi:enterochelin esterase [Streptomyces iconiensis]|uniref:Enterochelin esterase n=1 Tax=Streptomyces iconiensis TaxID=1384038 RepID=A0ABT7A6W3_9ACTN|nr:enterochelin esterase [Streptomyces iconiensis]MDJ1137065.1 enterochelin esterase [Streptomyces iconiensis]